MNFPAVEARPAFDEFSRSTTWNDAHFGYDMDFDFYGERKDIHRPDGVVLWSVPTLNSTALYSVHFCTDAREIWAVDLRTLASVVEFDRKHVTYSPRRIKDGHPSARGYCLPVEIISEAGHCWNMPDNVGARLDKATNKKEAGLLAERLFEWLVNERKFFPTIFVGKASKASRADDYRNGVDFWMNDSLPVQIKLDGPGGRRGTGNLFFQTHTMSADRANEWHGYERTPRHE